MKKSIAILLALFTCTSCNLLGPINNNKTNNNDDTEDLVNIFIDKSSSTVTIDDLKAALIYNPDTYFIESEKRSLDTSSVKNEGSQTMYISRNKYDMHVMAGVYNDWYYEPQNVDQYIFNHNIEATYENTLATLKQLYGLQFDSYVEKDGCYVAKTSYMSEQYGFFDGPISMFETYNRNDFESNFHYWKHLTEAKSLNISLIEMMGIQTFIDFEYIYNKNNYFEFSSSSNGFRNDGIIVLNNQKKICGLKLNSSNSSYTSTTWTKVKYECSPIVAPTNADFCTHEDQETETLQTIVNGESYHYRNCLNCSSLVDYDKCTTDNYGNCITCGNPVNSLYTKKYPEQEFDVTFTYNVKLRTISAISFSYYNYIKKSYTVSPRDYQLSNLQEGSYNTILSIRVIECVQNKEYVEFSYIDLEGKTIFGIMCNPTWNSRIISSNTIYDFNKSASINYYLS